MGQLFTAKQFGTLYRADATRQTARYASAVAEFHKAFGTCSDMRIFSAPGRSEIGGNHTDHQQGRVLAAAVTLDLIAVTAARTDSQICICSAGYSPIRLSTDDLAPRKKERNTSVALVRGIAARLRETGYAVGGFDAYITSDVPKGSGLSSSAAYSILIATIFSYLYNDGNVSPVEQALISKYSENNYFGKPSGLMDQLASASGGFVAIDFCDPEKPVVERVDCDLEAFGYAICIVDARGSHANLTPEYAAVPAEMGQVAACFGKTHLREVDERLFFDSLGSLRQKVSDRALLRAIHFFEENARVPQQVAALKSGDMKRFRDLMLDSGNSSFTQLQNVCPTDASERSIALALALSSRMLRDTGAWRIHGGGFAGTMQALVPLDQVDAYAGEMERVFGEGCCYRLAVRPVGGVEINLS